MWENTWKILGSPLRTVCSHITVSPTDAYSLVHKLRIDAFRPPIPSPFPSYEKNDAGTSVATAEDILNAESQSQKAQKIKKQA